MDLITGLFTIMAFVALRTMRVSWYLLEQCFLRLTVRRHPLDSARHSQSRK